MCFTFAVVVLFLTKYALSRLFFVVSLRLRHQVSPLLTDDLISVVPKRTNFGKNRNTVLRHLNQLTTSLIYTVFSLLLYVKFGFLVSLSLLLHI
jgi:hypothetical protein